MEKMSQKCAVYVAITGVLREKGISFEDGADVSGVLTADMRSVVVQMLILSFEQGKIQLESAQGSRLKQYISGLVSNWIRKDKRLNGGTTYKAKSSRAGSGDSELKNLMLLFQSLPEGGDGREEVARYIKARKLELEKSKVRPVVVVDFSKLPEALRAKYTK